MPTAELSPDGRRINVVTAFREKDLIKAVPGAKYDATERTWFAPLTWAACKALRGVFGDRLVVGPALSLWARDVSEGRVGPCLDLRERLDLEAPDLPGYLFPFQRAGVRFLQYAGQALVGSQMRTGKTAQCIAFLQTRPDSLPALVIAPNSVKRVWARELERFAPELRVVVLEGSAAKRRKAIKDVGEGRADIAVVNWEALRTLSRLAPYGSTALRRCVDCGGEASVTATRCEVHERDLNEVGWATVIADEAHRMKDPKAKQTRGAWWLGRNAKYRFALTGTPIANHPGDLWSLLHFVDPEEWPSKVRYVDRYCLVAQSDWGGLDIMGLQPRTMQEFFEVFNPRFIRHLRDAVQPQLPPKVYAVREVELTPKQRRSYDQLRDECIAELEAGTLVAVNALARMTRLSQLACAAGVMSDDGDMSLTVPSCKVDALLELVEELEGERAVVFAESRQLLELCSTALESRGILHGKIMGGVSADDRVRAEEFDDGAQLLLATLGAGGEGLDFSRAATVIFLQRSWSAVKNQQAEDRALGPAQEASAVQVIDVVARDTVEEYRAELLLDKGARLEEVVRDQDVMRRLLR